MAGGWRAGAVTGVTPAFVWKAPASGEHFVKVSFYGPVFYDSTGDGVGSHTP